MFQEIDCRLMIGKVLVEFGLEFSPIVASKLCGDAVIGFADKGLDLLLALGDEPHSHTLHASSRQAGLDLAPEHR